MTPANAADPISISRTSTAQTGGPPAEIRVDAQVNGRVTVNLTCSGKRFGTDDEVSPGTQLVIQLPLPEGEHKCSGSLAATGDVEGKMSLQFDVRVFPQLALSVAPEHLDLLTGKLKLQAPRQLAEVELAVYAPDTPVQTLTVQPAADGTIAFTGNPDIVKLVATATDTLGYRAELELMPWSYAIPHEDIVFASGDAAIPAEQERALLETLDAFQATMNKYSGMVPVELFIGGYTDSVGDSGSNQRLSESRAKSIARWYRAHGFSGTIWFQGFGEDALLVPTGDNVDEPANRRAVYLMASQPPATGQDFPSTAWKKLP